MTATATCDIRIVSLASATGRRARLTSRLDQLDLSYSFVDALDAATSGSVEIYDGMSSEGPWGWISSGDAACTQSHRRAWRAFLATDATHMLGLEDDVMVSDLLPGLLADLSWWPEGADVIKFERWKSSRLKVLLGQVIPVGQDLALRQLRSRHPGSAAYLLSRAAARRLLSERPVRLTIDQWLFNPLVSHFARDSSVFQFVPALAEQGAGDEEQMPGALRTHPGGAVLWRQKARRGWAEIRGAFVRLPAIVAGRLSLIRLPLAPDLAMGGTSSRATDLRSD